MTPRVRFARTRDDVSVAYWVHGTGPVLVQTPLVPFSHIEMEWQNPHLRRWYELVADAQLTVLEGRSPLPGAGDTEGPARVIAGFLGASRDAGLHYSRRPDRVLATVLFTDIVGSTERAAEIGDRAWLELLDRHHDAVREDRSGPAARSRGTRGDPQR